ncbi:Mitochondrial glycoprotein [Trema orientale]|uniref:Mitochondrial glycoprotein n=1 Tax=Trema orientale TaxID=63057 RepID=A0A2P5FN63_TREOI|nr:Mitochondrial glycoprotein [Trema orientale]
MARLLRASQDAILRLSSSSSSSSPRTQFLSFLHHSATTLLSPKPTPTSSGVSEALPRSAIEANIVRVLRNEIQYQSEFAPTDQPVTKFKSFTVQDRPGEQWIILRGKYGEEEDIKIDVTMFDGYELSPKHDSIGEDMRLHLSVLVHISKGDGSKELLFVCSAWRDGFEVQNVYLLPRDRKLARVPYMGPHIGRLNGKFQEILRDYLGARGINDELSFFLHDYIMNKDRIELVQWLRTVKSFVEK